MSDFPTWNDPNAGVKDLDGWTAWELSYHGQATTRFAAMNLVCGYCGLVEGTYAVAAMRRFYGARWSDRTTDTMFPQFCEKCRSGRTRHEEKAKEKAQKERVRKQARKQARASNVWATYDDAARTYGITRDQAFLLQRIEPCRICGALPDPTGKKHHIDHDHKTGRVRGGLCESCNTRGLSWYEAMRGRIDPIPLFEDYLMSDYVLPDASLGGKCKERLYLT